MLEAFLRQGFPLTARRIVFGEGKASDRAGADPIRPSCRTGLLLALSFLPLVPGCATAPATPTDHAEFHDLGELGGDMLDQAVRLVLVRDCGFSLARRSRQFATVYYETGWKQRAPLSDEQVRGIIEARTRLLIRGQRVDGGRYRVLLEGENEIRTDSIPEWSSAPVTRGFTAWMDRLTERLLVAATSSAAPADSTDDPCE